MSEEASSQAPRDSWVTVPAGAPPAPLLDFLDSRFPRMGRVEWRRRLEAGRVRDESGQPAGAAYGCRPGMRFRYRREVVAEPAIPFAETILHEDDRLLAVDKPHFVPVTPSGGWVNESLLYRLVRRTGLADLQPVHRLDRETAGVVLFVKTRALRGPYAALFAAGRARKLYEALAPLPAAPGRTAWTMAGRIEKGDPWFRVRTVPGAVNARTRIRLVERRGAWGRYEIEPETGKQHQIRLHMAASGCPVWHDRYYPDLLPERQDDYARPLQLVGRELAFDDPVTGARRVFRSACELAWPATGTA